MFTEIDRKWISKQFNLFAIVGIFINTSCLMLFRNEISYEAGIVSTSPPSPKSDYLSIMLNNPTFIIIYALFGAIILANLMYGLEKSIEMDREENLKLFLSSLKELPSQKIRLELGYFIREEDGSKVWTVDAYTSDEESNVLMYGPPCNINNNSNFSDVLSLLVNTGYEISVLTKPANRIKPMY